MVLTKKVTTSNGKEILERHRSDKDCAAIMAELCADAHASPAAINVLSRITNWLTSARYNPKRDGKSEECCVKFNAKMDLHDEYCIHPGDKLNKRLRRRYLQGYFSEVTAISRIWTASETCG